MDYLWLESHKRIPWCELRWKKGLYEEWDVRHIRAVTSEINDVENNLNEDTTNNQLPNYANKNPKKN